MSLSAFPIEFPRTATSADEIYARAMLHHVRRSYDTLDTYAQTLPDIEGKDDLADAIAKASFALEAAAEAIASAIDEASCDESCHCSRDPFHRKLRAPEPQHVKLSGMSC